MWHLMQKTRSNAERCGTSEWMLDDKANISDGSEPEDSGEMGSLAYTAGFGSMWQKDARGAWVKLGGGTNG